MKILTDFIYRNIINSVIIAATIICPLVLIMPDAETRFDKILLCSAVVLFAAIEFSVSIFVNFKMIISPLRAINKTAKKLNSGDYTVHTKIKYADEEIKQLSKNINNISSEFDNLEQMRKSFVANASHELRSPLTSMQGFLQAISDGTIDKENSEKYIKIVLNETKRLNSLITSMLDLSRMESGKNPLVMSCFEINAVIKQIIERFEPSLIKKEIQLDADFVNESCLVYADKDKIIQVLINLIDNAIKYSPAYSRILVTTHIHNKKIYVTVKDRGFGIGKKDQMLIWDRFYMADKAHTPNKTKGTGLGLSIVKKIIDDHNESIWVESNKGAGATFIFTLTLFDSTKHKIENGTVNKTNKRHKQSIPQNAENE